MGLLSNYSPTFREEKAVDFLSRFVKNELNFDRVVVDEVGNLIASYGRGDRSIALIGHIDTVQGFIPVIIDNGLIWGRGAVDAKGPLTSAFIGASSAR
ncbi:MAG: acetylornithine deacetylase, partial [Thermoprotei archaeon]